MLLLQNLVGKAGEGGQCVGLFGLCDAAHRLGNGRAPEAHFCGLDVEMGEGSRSRQRLFGRSGARGERKLPGDLIKRMFVCVLRMLGMLHEYS